MARNYTKKSIIKKTMPVALGAILIVALIVGITWAYWPKHSSKETAVATSAQAPASSTLTHTGAEATTAVQTTYDTYLTALNNANNDSSNTQPVAQVGLAAVKSKLSPGLYAKAATVTQATPFSCTSQFATDKYTASLKSASDSTALVNVTISNGSGLSTSGMIATVDLKSLMITAVTCPL